MAIARRVEAIQVDPAGAVLAISKISAMITAGATTSAGLAGLRVRMSESVAELATRAGSLRTHLGSFTG